MARNQPAKIVSQIPVRIPVPDSILQIVDQNKREKAIESHWIGYGYSDRYILDGVIDGHIIMVRK